MTKPRKNGEATGKKPQPPVEHQFKPGNQGRPKGSRNKFGERFISDLYADWQQHGAAVIQEVRESQPDVYLKVAASLLPKELKIERSDELSDEQLDSRIRELAGLIGLEIRAGEPADREEAPGKPKLARDVSTLQ